MYYGYFTQHTFVHPNQSHVAWYPYNGNTDDESGNGNNGAASCVALTIDRNGIADRANFFNKQESQKIEVADLPQQGISDYFYNL